MSRFVSICGVLLMLGGTASAQMQTPSAAPSSTASLSNCKPPEQVGNPAEAAPGGEPFKVWVDSKTEVFYRWGSRYYGKTPCGQYMSEADALAAGARHEGWYVEHIQMTVARHWSMREIDANVPAGAKVTVYFTISRAGSISDLRVFQSSGWPSLDESCLKAVRDVSQFDPLPATYKGSTSKVSYFCDYRPHK